MAANLDRTTLKYPNLGISSDRFAYHALHRNDSTLNSMYLMLDGMQGVYAKTLGDVYREAAIFF